MLTLPQRPAPLPTPPPTRWRPPAARRDLLAAGRRLGRRLADCDSQDRLLEEAVSGLTTEFDIRTVLVLLRNAAGELVERAHGSRGPAAPAQIARRLAESATSRDMPARAATAAGALQLTLPLRARDRVMGALYLEIETIPADTELEDSRVMVAAQLAAMMDVLRPAAPAVPAASVVVRRYAANDSLFVDDTYLIKGVAGNILWKLLSEHQRNGRRSFTNRELRVDPSLRLPEIGDNLEARLILLRRRLAKHGEFASIEKTGRGRFDLRVTRPLRLVEVV